MKRVFEIILTSGWLLAGWSGARADLVVKVGEPKQTSGKAVITLEMKNTFAEKVESARAMVFLLDEQGKMVGQATRWVIVSGSCRWRSS